MVWRGDGAGDEWMGGGCTRVQKPMLNKWIKLNLFAFWANSPKGCTCYSLVPASLATPTQKRFTDIARFVLGERFVPTSTVGDCEAGCHCRFSSSVTSWNPLRRTLFLQNCRYINQNIFNGRDLNSSKRWQTSPHLNAASKRRYFYQQKQNAQITRGWLGEKLLDKQVTWVLAVGNWVESLVCH